MLTEEEIKEQAPEQLEIFYQCLIINNQLFKEYCNGDMIYVDHVSKVPVDFIRDILESDNVYTRCINLYNNSKELKILALDGINICDSINIPLGSLVMAIWVCLKKYDISLTEAKNQKIRQLKNMCTLEQFEKDFGKKAYAIKIEGNDYKFMVLDLMKVLNMDPEQFEQFFNSNTKDNLVYGVSKEKYLYALNDMITNHYLLQRYFLGQKIMKNYDCIRNMKKIDFEATNQFLRTIDYHKDHFSLNPLLVKEVISEMPKHYDNLEKAIYIYIKLCDILTYSLPFFAYNQDKNEIQKHNDISRLNHITKNNNEIVCWEYTKIYGKFLNMLGINYITDSRYPKTYAGAHESLNFRYDKYLISADTVKGVINGDLINVKERHPLNGIVCYNKNVQSSNQVNEIIERIYDEYKKSHSLVTTNIVGSNKLIDQIDEYKNSLAGQEFNEVVINRFKWFLELLKKRTSGSNLDLLSGIKMLSKNIFSPEELDNYFDLTLVREYLSNYDNEIMLSAILTLNAQGFNQYPDKSIYFKFNPIEDFKNISKEELNLLFENKLLQEQSETKEGIPGITREVKESHGQII